LERFTKRKLLGFTKKKMFSSKAELSGFLFLGLCCSVNVVVVYDDDDIDELIPSSGFSFSRSNNEC